ncbi:hypothetical protein FRC10_004802 [Ceratobasidium sp. 414]|nr:hypothetical protein FRC10_004802 [Ceratobasidium sp. 414]
MASVSHAIVQSDGYTQLEDPAAQPPASQEDVVEPAPAPVEDVNEPGADPVAEN